MINLAILDKHLGKRNENGDEDYEENSSMDKQQWENEQKVVKMFNFEISMHFGKRPDQ